MGRRRARGTINHLIVRCALVVTRLLEHHNVPASLILEFCSAHAGITVSLSPSNSAPMDVSLSGYLLPV